MTSTGTITRQRNESKEGKKARKRAMKVDRKVRTYLAPYLLNANGPKHNSSRTSVAFVRVFLLFVCLFWGYFACALEPLRACNGNCLPGKQVLLPPFCRCVQFARRWELLHLHSGIP